MRIVVVLPAPLGPSRPTISPALDVEVDAGHGLDLAVLGPEGAAQAARLDHDVLHPLL